MDTYYILEILNDWNLWKKELDTGIIRKKYLDLALRYLKPNVVLSIIGVRRSGKSYIMRQLAKELIKKGADKRDILIVNLEDRRFSKYNLKLLDQIFDAYYENLKPKATPYIFLDEIHKVRGWERWVRTIHELNKAKVIVSSSSAKLMSGELATVLTGRHLDIISFPLSFNEFLFFKGIEIKNSLDLADKKTRIKSLFAEYLEFGGFPEVVLNQEKNQLLTAYFEDIITKDIEQRYKIREKEKLMSLAKFYLTNISGQITFNSLKKFLELSTDTIEKFSSYMQEAELIFMIKRFSYKVKEQEKASRKIYSMDVGLSRAVGFRFSENLGAALENIVAIELKSMITLNPLLEIYYWQNQQKKEVDFLIKEGKKIKQLIQVSYNINNPITAEREQKALIKTSEELKCNDLLILTYDTEKKIKVGDKTIVVKPIWKWLLE